MQSAVLYSHLCPVRLHHIFLHYLIKGTIFGKMLQSIKCVFLCFLQPWHETFLILRRTEGGIVINVHRYSCKVPVILIRLYCDLNFLVRS
jgi:hypothetical protein